MTPEQALAIAGAVFGSGSALAILAKGIIGWLSGAAGREKERNQDLLAQRNDAWTRTEYERRRADEAEAESRSAHIVKRRALELASEYRRQLIAAGIEPAPWPTDLK